MTFLIDKWSNGETLVKGNPKITLWSQPNDDKGVRVMA